MAEPRPEPAGDPAQDPAAGQPRVGLPAEAASIPHRRRPRYAGRNPRRFEEKYKERDPGRYSDTVAKVLASGKTPAGTHRPILVAEILEVLVLKPGEWWIARWAMAGMPGNSSPGSSRGAGSWDSMSIPGVDGPRRRGCWRRGSGPRPSRPCAATTPGCPRSSPASGAPEPTSWWRISGVSSMQIDDPSLGFSVELEGPLDMRMNPGAGRPASALLASLAPRRNWPGS